MALLRKIIECFQGEGAHFDLSLANEFGLVGGGKSDFLVFHLSELARMCFMAVILYSDHLRLEGLLTRPCRSGNHSSMDRSLHN